MFYFTAETIQRIETLAEHYQVPMSKVMGEAVLLGRNIPGTLPHTREKETRKSWVITGGWDGIKRKDLQNVIQKGINRLYSEMHKDSAWDNLQIC